MIRENSALTGADGMLAVNNGWTTYYDQKAADGPLPFQVLMRPTIVQNQLNNRGVIICGNEIIDDLFREWGEFLKKYWFVICTTQSHRVYDSIDADLHMFSNTDAIDKYEQSKAGRIPFVTYACGMFTDTDFFVPDTKLEKIRDVIYVAKWFPTKRIELLLDAMPYLRKEILVTIVTVPVPTSSMSSISTNYREKLLERLLRSGLNVDLVEAPNEIQKRVDGTYIPGGFTSEQMRDFYNQSRLSVLLADYDEGINRSICEAMSCNLPVLMAADMAGGTKYLVEPRSGMLVDPNPKLIAKRIEYILDHTQDFSSREVFISKYGQRNSMEVLKDKIVKIMTDRGEQIDLTDMKDYNGGPWTKDHQDIFEPLLEK